MNHEHRKAPRPLESAVLRECLRIAERMEVPCWRRNVSAQTIAATSGAKRRFIRSGQPGQSDLWGFLPKWSRRPGVHFECEIKRLGEAPRYEQAVWLRQCNEVSAAAFWCDNTETFARVLQAVCEGKQIVYPYDHFQGVDYRVTIPGTKKTRVIRGPSYEYDLI